MKEINKCPNCGAAIEYNEDKTEAKCPYCKSTFDLGESQPEHRTATIKDLQIDENDESYRTPKGKFSLFIFIILFVINPVFAIIYAIIKSSKK